MSISFHRLVNQGEVWVTREGVTLQVAEMSSRHRRNATAMLMRSASRLAFGYVLSLPIPNPEFNGDAAVDAAEDAAVWPVEHPQAWMASTALYRALVHDVEQAVT